MDELLKLLVLFSAESTALHYSNGSSDTQCERGSTMGNATLVDKSLEYYFLFKELLIF